MADLVAIGLGPMKKAAKKTAKRHVTTPRAEWILCVDHIWDSCYEFHLDRFQEKQYNESDTRYGLARKMCNVEGSGGISQMGGPAEDMGRSVV